MEPMEGKAIGILPAVGLVLQKNLMLKIRNWRQVGMEIILPTLFTACLIPAWAAVGKDKKDPQTFVPEDGSFTNYTTDFNALKCSIDGAVPGFDVCDAEWITDAHCIANLCMRLPENDNELIPILMDYANPRAGTIPDYDTVALLRKFASAYDLPGTNDYGQNVPNAISSGYLVAVVPGSDLADPSLVGSLDAFLAAGSHCHQNISRTGTPDFADEDQALDFVKSREGSQMVWALVILNSRTDYEIRMNRTAVPDTFNSKSASMGLDESYQLYQTGGFVTLQNMVNWWITDPQMLRRPKTEHMTVYPMPIAAYEQDMFISNAGAFLPLILCLALLFPVAQMVALIVREKESRIREGMLIMGLPGSAFKISWTLTIWAQMSLTALLVAFVMGVSMLSDTKFLLIFLLFWLYCLSLGGLAILFSVFFSKGSTAVTLAPMLFFATALPGFILDLDTTGSGTSNALSIFSNYAFSMGIHRICKASGSGTPLDWSRASEESYSFNTALWWLFVDTLLYLALALYFDMVFPSEWGAPKPFYFVVDPRYWLGKKYGKNEGYTAMEDEAEAQNASFDQSLREVVHDPELAKMERVTVKGVKKVFDADGVTRVANDNVNLSLYEGQILALLGHNGAGKTTLINMLTGMLPLTSGDATVYGNSIVTEMGKVRTTVGLCPQHNILWDNLTCFEHMLFYAALKGVPRGERQQMCAEMLDKVGLGDKHHVYSASLSGGMKRKLSVAISLIGDSKFVILDEPTAGMDVQARRAIWDLLKEARIGRTILLTTHFMDEADLLGDSIAILSAGKVYCYGSSFFLKQKLGVGYNLKIDIEGDKAIRDRQTPRLLKLIKEQLGTPPAPQGVLPVQQPELLASAGGELTYRVPMWGLPHFGALFEALETSGKDYDVMNFGMSVTTLEEIFIKVANDSVPQVNPVPTVGSTQESTPLIQSKTQSLDENLRCINIEEKDRLHGNELTKSQWKGLFYKRARYSVRDRKTICFQLILPVVLVIYTLALANIPIGDPPAINVDSYKDRSEVPIVPGDVSPWFTPFPRDNMDVQSVLVTDLPGDDTQPGPYRMDQWLLSTANARGTDDDRWEAVAQDDLTNTAPTFEDMFSIFHNATSFHAIPILLSQMTTAELRSADETATIRATNRPFPFSEYVRDQISGFMAITTGISLLIPFAFIPANYIGFLVKERESKAKHVQIVSGVQLAAYWASNFAWDLVCFCISATLSFLIFFMFSRNEYVGSFETFTALIALFLFYALGAISSTYLTSFYFKSPTSAQNIVMAFNFMTGFILVLTVFILKIFPSTESVGDGLRYVFRLIPCFCLGDGMVSMAQLPSMRRMGVTDDTAWSMNVVGWNVLFLALTFPVYLTAAMTHDFPQILYILGLKKEAVVETDDQGTLEDEDEDVAAERHAVLAGREGDVVTVRRLRKVFPAGGGNPKPKVAVRDLTFGVKQDEIFAFLGTNGAGKTTTISVLAGDYTPTSGAASIKGYDVVVQAREAKRELGYCPQFDALIDLLTPREHLDVYCSLRGVPYHLRKRMSDALMEVLDLTEHADTIAKSLSGGNKRKTSIAISLIGGPSCVLLDEPTAGIDPVARRGMWTALQSLSGGRSVILTTHHLEEVEALAHRTAIMVNGGLECLGSLTHLKAKFGGAYEIQVKTDGAQEAAVKEFFANDELLKEAQLIESTNHRLTYKVPGGTKLSVLFKTVQAKRDSIGIIDYSISQTSLEQVFIAICKKYVDEHHDAGAQRDEDEELKKSQHGFMHSMASMFTGGKGE